MSSIEELLINLTCNSLSIVGKSAFSHIAKLAVNHVKDQITSKAKQKTKLSDLKQKFEMKLSIITPTIDLFEIMVARGNSSLTSAMNLTLPLKEKINTLMEKIDFSSCYSDSEASLSEEYLINSLTDIIVIIDNITPMLNLALLTSQTILQQSSHGSIQTMISPSKIMRATIEINKSEMEFLKTKKANQVGPSFPLKLYSLFTSSSRKGKLDVDWTWKEEFLLSRTFIKRVKNSEREFNYELEIVENLEDGRYHEPEEIDEGKKKLKNYPLERNFTPGRKIKYDVCNIKSLYYTNAGSLLNIQGCTSAVLVLKMEINSLNEKNSSQEQWIAFELNNESINDDDDDSESDSEETKPKTEKRLLKVKKPTSDNTPSGNGMEENPWGVLSHLEYLLRLTMLENYLQTPCTLVNDEILTLFLQSSFSQSQNQGLIRYGSSSNNITNISLLTDSKKDANENSSKSLLKRMVSKTQD